MLKDFISELKDPRQAGGVRYRFDDLMTIIIFGTCLGYVGYRELARFAKNNSDYLITELGLTHGIPCHNTFRRLLQKLKSDDIIAAFNTWAVKHYPIIAGSALSADGQVLRATVTNHDNNEQNFITVVSLFSSQTGITHAIDAYKKKDTTEYHILAKLLAKYLRAETPILQQADAFHSKKNT
jgi:DDE_Tnp_1-associated